MGTLMTLKNVGYRTADRDILHDINWDIPEQAHLTLTGPSGGGKSTLLQLMASLISPTSGEVQFQGQPQSTYDPIAYRRQVSYCFQLPTLFGETVADNLAFPYQIRKLPVDQDHVKEALANVGLAPTVLDQPVDKLSGGERQRVALIRNVLFLPKLLLLDEVTASLDEENKTIIHHWLHHLNVDRQVTTIMITHDSGEIQAASQLVRLTAGELEVGA
ncbi:MAG TPA: ATP-binding cassette domain-containing protein [Candidatus Levilactobacillus faecigallinarum]|uniref:ATP-binding cassette domain-containing protein n=1 Tax=Candidatus Levilactobacillus faecigallinarum TaxID=2838638 RepID=A0A9D1QRB4_9LACO|nr:ATP-binding cassette domain-containing protein [Candidatus Levilactobacillus faecigallinarum]